MGPYLLESNRSPKNDIESTSTKPERHGYRCAAYRCAASRVAFGIKFCGNIACFLILPPQMPVAWRKDAHSLDVFAAFGSGVGCLLCSSAFSLAMMDRSRSASAGRFNL